MALITSLAAEVYKMIGVIFCILRYWLMLLLTSCITAIQYILHLTPEKYGNTIMIPYYMNGIRYQILLPVCGSITNTHRYVNEHGKLLLSYRPPPGIKHYIDNDNVHYLYYKARILGDIQEEE